MRGNKFLICSILLFIIVSCFIYGKGDKTFQSPRKVFGTPIVTHLDINNISTLISDEGFSDYNENGSLEGLIFPKGTNKTAVFETGFVWAGKVNGKVQAGGSAYFSGLQPGKILLDRTAEDTNLTRVRIYRVRPDFQTADLSAEVNDGEGSEEEIRTQYQKDWTEWPAADGAPFNDINHDGIYEPDIDIPGVPGADQTIWFVANDLDSAKVKKFVGSDPIGIELQVTIWGYKSSALDNMFFRKYKIINKCGKDITNMYLGLFTDADIGSAENDLTGCDTTLDLAYIYDSKKYGEDYIYGNYAPCVGLKLLQGPKLNGLPTDTATSEGEKIPGMKNLAMTSIGWVYKCCDPTFGDVHMGGDYEGTIDLYNYLQGLTKDGHPFPIPSQFGSGITKYPFSGDPISQQGFIDGVDVPPADRRVMINSGPFNMAPGDSQEVIYAEILGGYFNNFSNLAAVSQTKKYSQTAEWFFKNGFPQPIHFVSPSLHTSELDQEILLTWGDNVDSVKAVEQLNQNGFKFEGYDVYQLPSKDADLSKGIKISSSDAADGIKNVIGEYVEPNSGTILTELEYNGLDSGIERYFLVNYDSLNKKPLSNGINYYFAVTSVYYNGSSLLYKHIYESAPVFVTVVPHQNDPGIRYQDKYDSLLTLSHVSGNSTAKVIAIVIDPSQITGDEYQISFSALNDGTVWNLKDISKNINLVNSKSLNDIENQGLIYDGVLINIIQPKLGVKSGNYDIDSTKNGWATPHGYLEFTPSYSSGFNFEGFSGAIGWASPASVFAHGSKGVPAAQVHKVLLKLASVLSNGDYDPPFNSDDINMSYAYRYGINFDKPPAKPEFSTHIINNDTGFSYQDFTKSVPLSAWNIDDPANPVRLALGFTENNVPNGLVDGKYWPESSVEYDTLNNTDTNGPREWLWIFNSSYSENPISSYEVNPVYNDLPVMYFCTFSRVNTLSFSTEGTGSDQFEIIPNLPLTENDVYEFQTTPITYNSDLAKEDVQRINVFPNPYYSSNSLITNGKHQSVTFSHLPQNAVIKIFDISGNLIRTINKIGSGQFVSWDLTNKFGFHVSSGLYVVYINMPDLSQTKILKLAVIQSQ